MRAEKRLGFEEGHPSANIDNSKEAVYTLLRSMNIETT